MALNDHDPATVLRYLADHAPVGEQRPMGLTVTAVEPSRWTITVFTPRLDIDPVLTAEFGAADIPAFLELDRQQRFRWICHDLNATATMLPVRSGYCLTLGERILRNYHRTDTAPAGTTPTEISARYAEIQRLIRLSQHGDELTTLLDLDSASAVAAGRMTATGVPWDNDTYLRILDDRLGTATADDTYPILSTLDRQITMRFGGARFHWSHELTDAFDGEGITLPSSRLDDLARMNHPAVPLITEWRELDTLASRHGYRWAAQWTTDGRWWPRWQPAGTPSGRWSGQGGALQLPACLRPCVRAQAGRVIVAADFAQLDPRIWAHLSGDPHLTAIQGDLYEAIAGHLSVDRDKVKTAILAALYGQRIGSGRDVAALLSRAFPRGMAFLRAVTDRASRDEPVRTRLARTLPPPEPDTAEALANSYRDRTAQQRSAVAHRNREAANFVIAGTAAELATATLAALRRRLAGVDAHVVMFVHDEFVLDVADDSLDDVTLAIRDAATDGTHLVGKSTRRPRRHRRAAADTPPLPQGRSILRTLPTSRHHRMDDHRTHNHALRRRMHLLLLPQLPSPVREHRHRRTHHWSAAWYRPWHRRSTRRGGTDVVVHDRNRAAEAQDTVNRPTALGVRAEAMAADFVNLAE